MAAMKARSAFRALRRPNALSFAGAAHQSTLSVGVIGTGVVGGALLDQMNAANAGIEVRGIAGSKKMLLGDSVKLDAREKGLDLMDPAANLSGTDLKIFADFVKSGSAKPVIVDCTASGDVAALYPEWLGNGISVVTPNKKAGSADLSFYKSIQASAVQGGSQFMVEATVGAGLPLIKTLQGLVKTGDKVANIEGILSGTLSYIFNQMTPGKKFSDVVADAKAKGFTEPDPRDDLSGTDVQRKCVILARECGLDVDMDDVPVASLVPAALLDWEPSAGEDLADAFIESLKAFDADMDAKMAEAGDGVMRYVGVIDVINKTARVELKSYAADHPFAATQHADNVVLFSTERYTPRPLVVQGPGAGAEVTAAGVFEDILTVAERK